MFPVLLLVLASMLSAATRSLESVAAKSPKGFLVTAPLDIPKGDTLTIGEGSVVLFAPFTGLTVSGALVARGTKARPVTFSSVQDTAGTAAAFDWNGIDIRPGGHADLSFAFIGFSSSGITVADSAAVMLDSCIFQANGPGALSVAGSILPVPELLPFSFNAQTLPPSPVAGLPAAPAAPQESFIVRHWKYFAIGGIISAIGGSYLLWQSQQTLSDYNSYVPGNPSFDAAFPEARQDFYDSKRSTYRMQAGFGWSLVGLAVLDGGIFVVRKRF